MDLNLDSPTCKFFFSFNICDVEMKERSILMDWGEHNLLACDNETQDQMNQVLNLLPCAGCIVSYNENLSFIKMNTHMKNLFGFQKDNEFDDLKSLLSVKDYTCVMDIIADCIVKDISRFQFQASYLLNQQVFHFAYEGDFLNHKQKIFLSVTDVTQYRDVEIELNYIRQQHDILMNQTGHIISQYDIPTRTLYQPKKAANLFNLPSVIENVPFSIVDKIIAEESKQEYINFYLSMMKGEAHSVITIRARNACDEYAWYVMQYDLVYDVDNCPVRAIISYEDITDLQEKELAYKKWQNYFQSQQEKSIAYYEYNLTKDYFEIMEGELAESYEDEGCHTFVEIINYAIEHHVFEDDKETYLNIFSRQRLLSQFYVGEREYRFEHRRIGKNGKLFWALAIIQLISDPYTNDIMASILIEDINDEKESLLQLRHLSTSDPLTNLLNRSTMIQEVDELLQNSVISDTHILLMIDLDDFKILNDTMGHKFGDQVLLDIAKELRGAVRSGDLCARLGGDEFVVLMKHTPVDEQFIQRIQMFHQKLNRVYGNLEASTSIGLATFPKDGWCFDDLYQKADIALYKAKRNGRNQFTMYCEEEDEFE